MLKRLAMESGLVALMTALLLVLAATAGLPGRPEPDEAQAAGVPAPEASPWP